MRKRGRPEALDLNQKKEILAIVTVGCSRRTAAGFVDCAPSTIGNTAERDAEFAEKLAHAENTVELMHLRNINLAAKEPGNWRASAWALERLRPEYYARRDPENITPAQMADFTRRLAEMLIAEVPVDRYRKAMMKKLEEILCELKVK